jgi:hypothetical protein
MCGAELNVHRCDCKPVPDPRFAVLDVLKGGDPAE